MYGELPSTALSSNPFSKKVIPTKALYTGLRSRAAAIVAVVALAVACCAGAEAQSAPYKFDVGASLGMSGYLGDANRANLYSHPGFAGELSMRYLPDTRWALRGVLSTFGLSGNTADMTEVLPGGANYEFTSQVYALDIRGEVNFFAFGIGETYKRLRRWSPYLALGVGMSLSSSGGKAHFAPTIPMAVGLKYKAAERVSLALEFSMTKAMGDHVDGPDLADLNGIKSAFYKNTDWFSRLTIGVAYEFGPRCETCHYVD